MAMPKKSAAETQLQSLFAPAGGGTGAFSSKAADYVAARPDYPVALFVELYRIGALFPDALVADIAAGTGLFSGGLLQRSHAVIAVEPNGAMRAAAEARFRGHANYRSVEGSAEATTLDAASIDLVAAAQAFHWFDAAAARREWLRILKPVGQVALIWNTRPLSDPLHNAVEAVFGEFGGARHALLTQQQDLSKVPQFFAGAHFHEFNLAHAQRLGRDGLSSFVFSRSYMPDRDTPTGARAERAVHGLFDRFAQGDEVTVYYRTVAMVGRPNPCGDAE